MLLILLILLICQALYNPLPIFIPSCVSSLGYKIGSVCPSIRLCVCHSALSWLNCSRYEPKIWYGDKPWWHLGWVRRSRSPGWMIFLSDFFSDFQMGWPVQVHFVMLYYMTSCDVTMERHDVTDKKGMRREGRQWCFHLVITMAFRIGFSSPYELNTYTVLHGLISLLSLFSVAGFGTLRIFRTFSTKSLTVSDPCTVKYWRYKIHDKYIIKYTNPAFLLLQAKVVGPWHYANETLIPQIWSIFVNL